MGPTYFSDKSHRVTPAQSAELVAAMRELGGLDADGKLVSWVLEAAAPKMSSGWLGGPLVWDHVVGPSNVARAWHENMGALRRVPGRAAAAAAAAAAPAPAPAALPATPSSLAPLAVHPTRGPRRRVHRRLAGLAGEEGQGGH